MEKKKILKTVTALAFAAMVATSSLGVSARTTNLDYNLKKAYYITNHNKSMKIFYDYGTTAWYDDVRAETEAACAGGMTTYSYVAVLGEDGSWSSRSDKKTNYNGFVKSKEACIPSVDYAKKVVHSMKRKNNDEKKWSYQLTYNIT